KTSVIVPVKLTKTPSTTFTGSPTRRSCLRTTSPVLLLRSFKISSTSRSEREVGRSEEHTSELQSPCNLVCRLLLEKKKQGVRATPRRPSGAISPNGSLQRY